MNEPFRILPAMDRVLTALVTVLILGSALCFGGAVWWFRPAFAVLAFLLALITLARFLVERRMPIFKSPLTLLVFLAIGLGLLQLVPLPAALARTLSPIAHQVYSFGVIPDLARADSPSIDFGEAARVRSPATLDRAATLRWLFITVGCLAVFWAVSHFTDRLNRLYLVWGCVLGAFLINGAFGMVQLIGGVEGLYGYLRPGGTALWTPSVSDVVDSPSLTGLRRISDPFPTPGSIGNQAAVSVPDEPALMGTMMASSGAFLAFGSFALPLGLAIVLHMLLPRGSRESLSSRLSHKGQGSLIVLLVFLLVLSAFLIGMATGPRFCGPFLIALLAVGLPAILLSRGWAIALLATLLAAIGLGALLSTIWPAVVGGAPPMEPVSWERTRLLWTDSLTIFHNFPIVGTGFGSFNAIHPYVKTHDASSSTAMSSLLQCAAESGVVGLTLVGIAAIWVFYRLPGMIGHVGSADRTLAYGLIGSAAGCSLWSIMHWSFELPAVAISISALGGIWNRWLAGGTDLFVDCG